MAARMATCPHDGAPLISTMAFNGAEFYCLDCGRQLGFLSPQPVESTPEVEERYQQYKAEWDEHAGKKILTPSAWYADCQYCIVGSSEPHVNHATDEEREADVAARKWLKERIKS